MPAFPAYSYRRRAEGVDYLRSFTLISKYLASAFVTVGLGHDFIEAATKIIMGFAS